MRLRMVRRLGLCVGMALVTSLGCPPAGHAQTDQERAGARVAAQAGLDAFDSQKWAEALDLFARAESLLHAPVHLYYIGYSRMKLGKLVGAREAFLKLTNEHIPASAPKAFKDAQKDAAKELALLEPRIPQVTIVVAPEGKKPTVKLDGESLPPALLGLPTPVDPGTHSVVATADGWASDPVKVTVKEGGRETVSVTMKPVANAAAVEPAVSAAAAPPPSAAPADSTPPPAAGAPRSNALRTGAYVSFGVAALGLGAGAFFAVRSHGKRTDAEELCPGGQCPVTKRDDVQALSDDSTSAGRIAVISGAVSVAALGTGFALFFMSRPKSSDAAIAPYVGPGTAGVSGAFLPRLGRFEQRPHPIDGPAELLGARIARAAAAPPPAVARPRQELGHVAPPDGIEPGLQHGPVQRLIERQRTLHVQFPSIAARTFTREAPPRWPRSPAAPAPRRTPPPTGSTPAPSRAPRFASRTGAATGAGGTSCRPPTPPRRRRRT
jgi:hypothetical protein